MASTTPAAALLQRVIRAAVRPEPNPHHFRMSGLHAWARARGLLP